jgi:hypothetical protein
LGHHRRIRPPGLFALYVTGYSAFRIFEESLRVDPAHYILGLRLNFYVACALTSAGALWFLAIQRRGRASGRSRWRLSSALAVGGVALFACGCGQAGSSAVIHPPKPPSHSHISEERPPHPKHLMSPPSPGGDREANGSRGSAAGFQARTAGRTSTRSRSLIRIRRRLPGLAATGLGGDQRRLHPAATVAAEGDQRADDGPL